VSYAVIIEQGTKSWSARVPELPGCAAVGRTEKEVQRLIKKAITAHVALLRKQGKPVPRPR
jgi:predicted RNase H-like HicB family nuclease